MFIVLAILIGILIGVIRKGKLKNLSPGKIMLWPVGLIGIILQIVLHLQFYFSLSETFTTIAPIVNFVSYILILVMFVFNLEDFWTIMMAVGTTANFIVSFINGGKMPVIQSVVNALSNASLASGITQGTNAIYALLSQDTTTLWFLGINIPIPGVGFLTGVYGTVPGFSVGGAMIFIGIAGWIQYTMAQIPIDAPFKNDPEFGSSDYILASQQEPAARAADDFFQENEEGEMDKTWFDDEAESQSPFQDDDDLFEQTQVLFDEPYTASDRGINRSNGDGNVEQTVVLPELDPDRMKQIQNKKNPVFGEEKQDWQQNDDTQVFTALKNLGSYDTKPIPTFQTQENQEEEDFADSGFFTKSFYAEKEKGKLVFSEESQHPEDQKEEGIMDGEKHTFDFASGDEPKVTESKPERLISKVEKKQEPKLEQEKEVKPQKSEREKTPIWQPDPSVVRTASKRERPADVNKINPYRKYSNEEQAMKNDQSRKSERDMLNIWHQVLEDNEAARKKAKRKKLTDDSNPFQVENESRVKTKEKGRNAANKKSNNEIADFEKDVAQSDQGGKTVPPAVNAQSTMRRSSSDEEREKAGFEKVEINVEGRTVAFWRKKKQ
ncbi:MAG: DUF5317 family protein [Eubacteriaceae bacterium]|nr:DUF5317 family protein [Eubacteriaceae bacterium]